MDKGTLQAIWIKRIKGGEMDAVSSATLVPGLGIVGNADQGGERQVTVIEEEVWEDLMKQVGASLPPSERRANLMVSGVRLHNTEGRVLRIGACRIRVGGEATPSGRMDDAAAGLRELMSEQWRGGAYGEVVEGGEISIGDPVHWEAYPAP
jgi:MOSC domain-containing protein YiiM